MALHVDLEQKALQFVSDAIFVSTRVSPQPQGLVSDEKSASSGGDYAPVATHTDRRGNVCLRPFPAGRALGSMQLTSAATVSTGAKRQLP